MASNKNNLSYSLKYEGEKNLLGYIILILLIPAVALLFTIKKLKEYVEIEEYIKTQNIEEGSNDNATRDTTKENG